MKYKVIPRYSQACVICKCALSYRSHLLSPSPAKKNVPYTCNFKKKLLAGKDSVFSFPICLLETHHVPLAGKWVQPNSGSLSDSTFKHFLISKTYFTGQWVKRHLKAMVYNSRHAHRVYCMLTCFKFHRCELRGSQSVSSGVPAAVTGAALRKVLETDISQP